MIPKYHQWSKVGIIPEHRQVAQPHPLCPQNRHKVEQNHLCGLTGCLPITDRASSPHQQRDYKSVFPTTPTSGVSLFLLLVPLVLVWCKWTRSMHGGQNDIMSHANSIVHFQAQSYFQTQVWACRSIWQEALWVSQSLSRRLPRTLRYRAIIWMKCSEIPIIERYLPHDSLIRD